MQISKAVLIKSSSSGSGLAKNIARFIFDASNLQFDIPTKATCLFLSFSFGSSKLCNTFNGLFFDISANPISSKKTIEITLFFPSSITFWALLKTLSIPSDVDVNDP